MSQKIQGITLFEKKFTSKFFWYKILVREKLHLKRFTIQSKKNQEIFILMHDFQEKYGKEKIKKDQRKILDAKKKIKTEPLSNSRRQETLLLDGIVHGEWLGREISAFEASEFDDLKNSFDLVVILHRERPEEQDVIFTIDSTTAIKRETLEKKLLRKKNGVCSFCNIEYFSDGILFGRKTIIPRFILGLDSSLRSAAEKTLKINSHKLRISDFENFPKPLEEAIVTELFVELLLEIEFYLNMLDNERRREKEKLELLEKQLWRRFIITMSTRVKTGDFPETMNKNLKRCGFKKRQKLILDYLGFNLGEKDAFKRVSTGIVYLMKNLEE